MSRNPERVGSFSFSSKNKIRTGEQSGKKTIIIIISFYVGKREGNFFLGREMEIRSKMARENFFFFGITKKIIYFNQNFNFERD